MVFCMLWDADHRSVFWTAKDTERNRPPYSLLFDSDYFRLSLLLLLSSSLSRHVRDQVRKEEESSCTPLHLILLSGIGACRGHPLGSGWPSNRTIAPPIPLYWILTIISDILFSLPLFFVSVDALSHRSQVREEW